MMRNLLISLFLLQHTSESFSEVIPCDALGYLHYHCSDGKTCINRVEDFCNGDSDCPDGSDEYIFNASMEAEGGISCPSRKGSFSCHLPERYVCDHNLDCYGGEDECGCGYSFHCADGGCALKVQFCDGVPDCRDGSDEARYNRTSKIGFQCPVTRFHETHHCILPDDHVCDGHSDCDYGIDECFCDFSSGKGVYIEDAFDNGKCFRCFDESLIIPQRYVCDGIIHCPDMSDECISFKKKDFTTPEICNSVCHGKDCSCTGDLLCKPKFGTPESNETICLPSSRICDMKIDCEDGIDERNCAETQQYFQCRDNETKIEKSGLCNGVMDCADQSDEALCKELTDYFCYYHRERFDFVTDWENRTQTDDPRVSIPPGTPLAEGYPFHAVKCDGIPDCADLDDECYAPGCMDHGQDGCNRSRPGYCKFVHRLGIGFRCENSGSIILGREVCDGKPTCNDTHPELSDDELYCPDRFYCANRGASRLPIHISNSRHCDGIGDCDDESDEIGCPEASHFYCNDSGEAKFIRREEVCDGVMDCKTGVDECQNCNPSPFSDDERVIKSWVFAACLWVIGLIAVAGNLMVIIHNLKTSIMRGGTKSQPNSVAKINEFLVLNLCFADVLVGIYVIALAIKDASTSDYCKDDHEWRTSNACAAIGSIALIGSEASVFIISIMAGYRAFVVMKPFTHGKELVVTICVGFAWFASFLLSLIPHTRAMVDYFVSCVRYRFGIICHTDLERITTEFFIRGMERRHFPDTRTGASWDTLFASMRALNSSFVPEKYFGYYSAHSVCLPRLFPDPKVDYSWAYSLFIIVLNFSTLVFIVLCYVQIYRISTRRTLGSKVRAKDRDALLQRKITRIVVTDICCWLPICVMALITVSGGYVSEDAYAVTATILLPMNAALNPFLYSNVIDYIWEKMVPVRKWCGATSCAKRFTEEQSTTKTTNGTEFEGATRVGNNRTLESGL